MAKVKYDVSKASAGGDWEHVQPGLYIMKVEEMEHKSSKSGNPMFEIRMKPVAEADGTKLDGEFNSVWQYVLTDGSQDGRLRALTDALGLKAKGTIDTDAHKGALVLAQLKSDKDQDGEYRPRVAKLMAVPDDADIDAEAEEEEDEAEEEDEGIDLATLNRTQLKALIKEHELDIKVLKSTTDDQLREQIAEAFGGDDEEEEEPEPEEEEDDDESIDLAELNRTQLKALIKDNELEIRVLKSMSDDDIRSAIAESMGGESEEEDDEEEDDDESSNGYASMSIQDLKNALKERGLNMSGKKSVLVGRLEADDKKGGDPF